MGRVLASVALLAMLPASSAIAYSDPNLFSRDPSLDSEGGGGGLFFTGSPRAHGMGCEVCHVDGPTDVKLRLSALREGRAAELFDGSYTPGAVYEIEVAFTEDRLRPQTGCVGAEAEPCDLNLFSFEILDLSGTSQGLLCPIIPPQGAQACGKCREEAGAATQVFDQCQVLLADGFDQQGRWRNGIFAYSFFWRAPEEDVGPLMAYASGVDGLGRETEGGELTSYRNDGVVKVEVPIDSPSLGHEVASCAAIPVRDGALPLGAAVLIGLIAWRRRREHAGIESPPPEV